MSRERVAEVARAVSAALPDGGSAWLASIGAPTAEVVLARLPDRALAEVDPVRVLQWLRDLAGQAGDHRVATGTARALVALYTARRGPDHPDTWAEVGALGSALERAGAAEEGLRLLESAHRGLAHAADLRLASAAQGLGAALVRAGRWADALAPLRRAAELRRALAPDTAALVLAQLGELLQRLGRQTEALPVLIEAHAVSARTEGPTAPRTLARAHLAGVACNAAERWADAVRYLRPVFDASPADDPDRRAALAFELGLALDHSGADEEATRRVDEAVRLTRALSRDGAPHPALANRLSMMARLHSRRGRGDEAEGLLLEALEAEGRLHGEASPEVAAMTAQLGHFCYRQGRSDEAVGWMETATSLVETAMGAGHPQTLAVADAHTALLLELADQRWTADPEGARALAERAFEVGSKLLGHVHARTRAARELLARPSRR